MRFALVIFAFLWILAPANAQDQTATDLPSHEALFNSGLEFGIFLDNAERRKEMWHDNYGKGMLPEDLKDRAATVGGTWYLLAVAVDGCSDSVNTIPYLAHLAAGVEGIEMRVVHPDEGRHIMENHPTPDGRPSTPTVLVLNDQFEKVGVFIERPDALQEWALGEGKELSSSDFMTAKFDWYDNDLGKLTMEAVIEIIESAGSQ